MKRESIFRMIVGMMVLASAALTYWVSPWWLILTAFIGLNLSQSALTGWCLLENILDRLRLGET